ncbi:hypothetical protein KUTeg_018194 [Tegillarca granosa]|uniref:Copper type II ascorbate-dependent monooxygenase C-terminal domain-containing protein n=1 Tax=Tegillarca granosa TaxID=220873 RepID=A0ABQ9EH72_TEGGR|nr:hypothetical protein KUTeg_018194 [Tegillarca granosa]
MSDLIFNDIFVGKSESVNLYRNKELIREITNEETYKFDSPKTIKYDTPVKIEPGDELETTCVYQSIGNNYTTRFGEDTTSEMCFAFLSYYPKENLIDNTCLSWKSIQYCKLSGKIKPEQKVVRGCNITMLTDLKSEFTSHYLKEM